MSRNLGDVQIDLSRKYRGIPVEGYGYGRYRNGLDGALCAVRRTDLLKAEITDTVNILQFNSHRIMRYVFPAIAEIYCETVNNLSLFSESFNRNALSFSNLFFFNKKDYYVSI